MFLSAAQVPGSLLNKSCSSLLLFVHARHLALLGGLGIFHPLRLASPHHLSFRFLEWLERQCLSRELLLKMRKICRTARLSMASHGLSMPAIDYVQIF